MWEYSDSIPSRFRLPQNQIIQFIQLIDWSLFFSCDLLFFLFHIYLHFSIAVAPPKYTPSNKNKNYAIMQAWDSVQRNVSFQNIIPMDLSIMIIDFFSNKLPSSVVVELQLRIDPAIRSIREIINISRHRPVVRFLEVVASIHVTRIRWKVVWMSQATLSIHSMMYDVFSRLFLNGIFFNWFFLLDILVF